MKTQTTLKIIYVTILFLLTVFIWKQLYSAQFLEYDKNYGSLISIFILSIVASIFLVIMWFKTRNFIEDNSFATILFVVMTSPVTLMFIFYFYHDIFGKLKHG